jgi:cellulose synthase/poly-beta-1,6-N-acetylglucosamine synthase-like glycosyltransferase
MTRILIISPFRNEEHSIPLYLEALQKVDYPANLIDVFWLENDSSDNTLNMLKTAQPKMPFNSTKLRSINILGSVKKRDVGCYIKDIGYGEGRVTSWLVIWNEHFLPLIRKSDADYVMAWWADAIPPTDVIKKYLQTFKEVEDAGWVGGKMYRRYPRHNKVLSPWPEELFDSNEVSRCLMTGHVWMMPRTPISKCVFIRKGRDMHRSLVFCLKEQELFPYFNPEVFIRHVSNDGRIHPPDEDT